MSSPDSDGSVDPLEFVEDVDPGPGLPDETDMYLFYGYLWVLFRRTTIGIGP